MSAATCKTGSPDRSAGWYGDRLVTVVRHEDESHPHLHAYVLPDAADAEMRAGPLHPGFRAKNAIKDAGPRPGEDDKALHKRADAAYQAALRQWLNDYHVNVAQPCGLTRLGPGKRRLTRAQWQAEKTQARALRTALEKAADIRRKADIDGMKVKADTVAERALAASASIQAATAEKRVGDAKAAEERARKVVEKAQQEQEVVRRETSAARRLSGLGGLLRGLWDGLRRSKIQERIRKAVESEMSRLRGQAADAADRASKADAARRIAEEKARTLDRSLAEIVAQRDAARKEIARLRPPELEPAFAMKPRPKSYTSK